MADPVWSMHRTRGLVLWVCTMHRRNPSQHASRPEWQLQDKPLMPPALQLWSRMSPDMTCGWRPVVCTATAQTRGPWLETQYLFPVCHWRLYLPVGLACTKGLAACAPQRDAVHRRLGPVPVAVQGQHFLHHWSVKGVQRCWAVHRRNAQPAAHLRQHRLHRWGLLQA